MNYDEFKELLDTDIEKIYELNHKTRHTSEYEFSIFGLACAYKIYEIVNTKEFRQLANKIEKINVIGIPGDEVIIHLHLDDVFGIFNKILINYAHLPNEYTLLELMDKFIQNYIGDLEIDRDGILRKYVDINVGGEACIEDYYLEALGYNTLFTDVFYPLYKYAKKNICIKN